MANTVQYQRYPEAVLRKFVREYLLALGDRPDEVEFNVNAVIYGALRWIPAQGQGLEKLLRHTRQIREGGIKPGAIMTYLKERPATALLDANKGSGFVAATRAMQKSIEKARSTGIACVLVRNSNHYGTSGYYANMAAEAGMIGLAFTNAGPEMAPWGAKTGVLGTNPWGIAVPRSHDFNLILDMALTMSGQGMIRLAYREGRSVPITWAMTKEGKPSTNPAELLDGLQLPIGEFKGSGLSFMTDVISGVLSGSKFGMDAFTDLQNLGVGHTLIALDPAAYMEPIEFEARLTTFVNQVKQAQPINPDGEILLPGELEHRRMQERLEQGIPVDLETLERLKTLCIENGIKFQL